MATGNTSFLSPRRWADYIFKNSSRVAHNRWAVAMIFLLELAGCTIVPLPNALIIVAFVTAAPRKWAQFALGATVGSVVGGLSLYIIGRGFSNTLGERLIAFYGTEGGWAGVVEWFNSEWGISFILLAGITTGLFRVASLGAGFTAMDPVLFLALLSLSRCIRWFAECAAIKYFGQRMRNWPGYYFKYAALGAVVIFIAALLIVKLAV